MATRSAEPPPTAPLHQAMQAALERKVETLDTDRLHLYPYYGEAYAEVLLPGADPDFNFVFHWGPRLNPYERTLVHTLVYIARKQAGHAALQAALTGQPFDVPVELYIETVPERLKSQAREAGLPPPMSLTELTNLSASTIYRTLDSDPVKHFTHVEKGKRVHVDGRVITTPARFFVRVDPVPTPEQFETLRQRVAQKMLQDELGLLSGGDPPGKAEIPGQELISPTDASLTSLTDRSVTTLTDRSVISPTDRSLNNLSDGSVERALMPLPDRSVTTLSGLSGDSAVTCLGDRSDSLSARSVSETGHIESLQNPNNRNDSVTDPDGSKTETSEGHKSDEKLTEWRRKNEDLARYSSEALDDRGSFAYHIHVWHHARKCDHKRKDGRETLTEGVFAILSELEDRRNRTGRSQGSAWTKRTKEWFWKSRTPLPDKIREEDLDPQELAEVRAALAHLDTESSPYEARALLQPTPPETAKPLSEYQAWAERMARRAQREEETPG